MSLSVPECLRTQSRTRKRQKVREFNQFDGRDFMISYEIRCNAIPFDRSFDGPLMAGGSCGTQIWEITNEKQNEYEKRTASEWREHAVTRVNMISAALRMLLLLCLCMHKTLFIGPLAATRVSLWRCEIMWMNLMCSINRTVDSSSQSSRVVHSIDIRCIYRRYVRTQHKFPYQMSTWNNRSAHSYKFTCSRTLSNSMLFWNGSETSGLEWEYKK